MDIICKSNEKIIRMKSKKINRKKWMKIFPSDINVYMHNYVFLLNPFCASIIHGYPVSPG